jgi:hypothetical protein
MQTKVLSPTNDLILGRDRRARRYIEAYRQRQEPWELS